MARAANHQSAANALCCNEESAFFAEVIAEAIAQTVAWTGQ